LVLVELLLAQTLPFPLLDQIVFFTLPLPLAVVGVAEVAMEVPEVPEAAGVE
jgi:hypothetical protein